MKREIRRRTAFEPVIGQVKNGHPKDRNYRADP